VKRITASFLILFVGCAGTPESPEGRPPETSPPKINSRESEIGSQIHDTIVSSFRIYTEPRLGGYVSRIGKSVAGAADRKDFSYHFTILYDDRVYATGAPGGFVYITTGFLNFLENEAELAGILAHEIGELQLRNPTLSKSRQAVTRAAQTGAAVGPMFGQFGALAAVGLILLDAVAGVKEVDIEKQVQRADRLALRYVVAARQDPQGYLDVIGRLLTASRGNSIYVYDYLISRPMTVDRFQKVVAEFEKLPLGDKSFSANRDRFLGMTKGVREIYR